MPWSRDDMAARAAKELREQVLGGHTTATHSALLETFLAILVV